MDLTGKPFEASARKKNRKKISNLPQENQLNARVLKAAGNKLTFPLQTVRIKVNKT